MKKQVLDIVGFLKLMLEALDAAGVEEGVKDVYLDRATAII